MESPQLELKVSSPALEARQLTRIYGAGTGAQTVALKGINLKVDHGDFVAIMGPSGSGKSTLLNLLGALDRPTSGSVLIDGIDISTVSNTELARIRNVKIGFVFQAFNLIPRMTAIENVELPLFLSKVPRQKQRETALEIMDQLGIGSEADKKPTQMSGGQQQRVAVARALVTDPLVVLADEPTGNLDTKSADIMMDLLEDLHARLKKTLVIITHNFEVGNRARKLILLRDGMVEEIREKN